MAESELTIKPVAGTKTRKYDTSRASTWLIGSDSNFANAVCALMAGHRITVNYVADPAALPKAFNHSDAERRSVILDLDDSITEPLALIESLRIRLGEVPIIALVPSAGSQLYRRLRRDDVTVVLEKTLAADYVQRRLHQIRGTEAQPDYADNPGSANASGISFRQMTPDDAQREQAFVKALSASSRMSRFFSAIKELSPQLLERFTHVNYPQSSAIVATAEQNGEQAIIGVARYQLIDETGTAEFALVVADHWQRTGLGGKLLAGLIAIAAIAGLNQVVGYVQRENTGMLRLATSLGFVRSASPEGPSVVRVTKVLR